MALNPNIILSGRPVDVSGALNNALLGAQTVGQLRQQPLQNELLQQRVQIGQATNRQALQQEAATGLTAMKPFVDRGDLIGAANVLSGLGLSPEINQRLSEGLNDTPENVKATLDASLNAFGGQQGQDRFSATTQNLPGGITVQTTSSGGKRVSDAAGNVLTGKSAVDAVNKAEKLRSEQRLAEAAGKADIKTEADIKRKTELSQVERQQGAIDNGISAAERLPRINRGLALLEKISTGGITAKSKAVSDFFGTTSGDIGELNILLAQDMLNTISSFPGSLSEGELSVIQSISAGLSQGKEVNKRILRQLKRTFDRQVSRARRAARKSGDEDALLDIEELLSIEPSGFGSAGTATQAQVTPAIPTGRGAARTQQAGGSQGNFTSSTGTTFTVK